MLEAIKWRLYWFLFKIAFFIVNRRSRLRETLTPLAGKTFCLYVEGHPRGFPFKIIEGGYIVDSPHVDSPDLVFKGRFSIFWKILWGKVDSDSTFFQRRIMIEGNLAMALTLKNVLDNFMVWC